MTQSRNLFVLGEGYDALVVFVCYENTVIVLIDKKVQGILTIIVY